MDGSGGGGALGSGGARIGQARWTRAGEGHSELPFCPAAPDAVRGWDKIGVGKGAAGAVPSVRAGGRRTVQRTTRQGAPDRLDVKRDSHVPSPDLACCDLGKRDLRVPGFENLQPRRALY